MTTTEGHAGPGAAGAPPAPPAEYSHWPEVARLSSPVQDMLKEEIDVSLPRYVWINFLAWAYTDYAPGIIPWVDDLIHAVKESID